MNTAISMTPEKTTSALQNLCRICNQLKDIEEFPISTSKWTNKIDGTKHTKKYRRKECKGCHYKKRKPNDKAKVEVNRQVFLTYLNEHPCVDCGENNLDLLEFDHKTPTQKEGHISGMLHTHSWKIIEEEISKCDILCRNCHKLKTAKQLSWRSKN